MIMQQLTRRQIQSQIEQLALRHQSVLHRLYPIELERDELYARLYELEARRGNALSELRTIEETAYAFGKMLPFNEYVKRLPPVK
jgi:hypothetical protein